MQPDATWTPLQWRCVHSVVGDCRFLLPQRLAAIPPLTVAFHQANKLGLLARELSQLRMLRSKGIKTSKVIGFEHHLCHAASTFFLSPFDHALVLTMDEEGDGSSGMIAVGEGTRIRVLRKFLFRIP